MPTGGKLIAALAFGALAYFISDLIKPLLIDTEGSRVGMLSVVNGIVGMLMGWMIMGKGAGKTYRQSIGYGFTTMAAITFWCLIIWSGHKMLGRSVAMRYDGPMEALQQMAAMSIDYARLVSVQEILIPAAVGTVFVSWLTEFFARRWS